MKSLSRWFGRIRPGALIGFAPLVLIPALVSVATPMPAPQKFFPLVVGADLLRVLLYARISVVSSPVGDRSFKALCAADAAVCHGRLRVLILADTDSKSRTTKTSVACAADRFGSLCGVLDDHQLPDFREEMA